MHDVGQQIRVCAVLQVHWWHLEPIRKHSWQRVRCRAYCANLKFIEMQRLTRDKPAFIFAARRQLSTNSLARLIL
jgi:hypothetical protein